MSDSILVCKDELRRETAREKGYNGIDYLEVSKDQLELTVYFLGKAPDDIKEDHVVIRGGRRIRDIEVIDIYLCRNKDPSRDDCMIVAVDKAGDFSTYTLCLVELDEDDARTDIPFHGFDPRYYCLEFSFAAACPTDLDCGQEPVCPPEKRKEPEINYLAKDYASFRQLILDRLALIMPDWKERHAPDLGITLVEILAYVGDHLSYYQDAVATEAYLDTARQRISVRRHARLVDYQMHEGCNARAWVHIGLEGRPMADIEPENIFFITGKTLGLPDTMLLKDELNKENIPPQKYLIFEPLVFTSDLLTFSERDIKNPPCLTLIVKEGEDPIAMCIRRHLDEQARIMLERYDGASAPDTRLQSAIIDGMNRIILNEHKRYRQKMRTSIEELFPYEITHSRKPGGKLQFYTAHNSIDLYTWDDEECCLPAGTTEATLTDEWIASEKPVQTQQYVKKEKGKEEDDNTCSGTISQQKRCQRERKLQNLQPGDVLIFEEANSPKTNDEDDRDLSHRHAVRLTRVLFNIDPVQDQPVVEIEWAEEDALPFPLCISAIGPYPDCKIIENISVARGNIILVDHGRKEKEYLGPVQEKEILSECRQKGLPGDVKKIPALFRPKIGKEPLTFREPVAYDTSASNALTQDLRLALPEIELIEKQASSEGGILKKWVARQDLMGSQADDRHFVVEMDDERRAHLRFGDDELGELPKAGTEFEASYRIGSGPTANVGAEMISHIIFRNNKPDGIELKPRNPFPAKGGTDPEPTAEVKLFAPHVFQTRLQRAITTDDYARIVMRDFKGRVQRVAAELRWMGGWYEVLVAIDPVGSIEARQGLLNMIEIHLRNYRRVGHDVKVSQAIYVPLEIEMDINVLPHYLPGHVKGALLDRFSDHMLTDGTPGFFHPDNLTFGEGIYQSKLVATAQAVTGVECVVIKKFKRRFVKSKDTPDDGILKFGPLEIARLDNDPSFPENGVLQFNMGGG